MGAEACDCDQTVSYFHCIDLTVHLNIRVLQLYSYMGQIYVLMSYPCTHYCLRQSHVIIMQISVLGANQDYHSSGDIKKQSTDIDPSVLFLFT